MAKRELLKKLWQMGVGEEIVISGAKHKIEEAIKYEEDGDDWLNLVWHDNEGLEQALEIEGDKLTLWRETNLLSAIDLGITYSYCPKSIECKGEKYRLQETGRARTFSVARGGTIARSEMPYCVYGAKSGRKLAVETWDGEVRFYLSDGELPRGAVKIP